MTEPYRLTDKYFVNEDREPADVTALFCIANELAQLNNSIKELIRTQKNRGL